MDNDKTQQPAAEPTNKKPIKPSKSTKPTKQSKAAGQPNPLARKIVIGVVILLLAVMAGYGGAWLYDFEQSNRNPLQALQSGEDGNNVINPEGNDVSAVAAKVSPSVVSIVAGNGAGTGIIISQDGYILTNNHVVEGARNFSIVTEDGTTYENVNYVGTDPLNDIAFLKIDGAKDLPVAQLGNSGTVRIGQQVIAVGNALGQYGNSVTSGVISGLGRPIVAADQLGRNAERLSDLIQTDAAINSGNSGGPLVNMSGQVIGVNVAVAQGANTIGFAIPINATKGIIASVLEKGEVDRSYIGVRYIDITPEVIAKYDLPVNHGAFIYVDGRQSPVVDGSPADRAGIERGDIITAVNDQEVGKSGELVSLIGQYRPGDQVELTVLRDSETIKLDITLGSYQD